MKHLILMRHAHAVRSSANGDHERELTPDGWRAASRMGVWIRQELGRPNLALVSDAQRTRDTFAGLAKAFDPAPHARIEASLYDASYQAILDIVRRTDSRLRSLLVVGHNPGVGELALLLAGPDRNDATDRVRDGFPPGASAYFVFDGDWRELALGGASLCAFATPADFDSSFEDE